jgi:anaerobic selenocysteine-containing dehydrogenase
MRLSAGSIGSPPFLMKTVSETVLNDNDTLVEVNPNTAKKYGLKEGRYALLKTPIGFKKVKIYLSQGIGEGIISFPRGLGHTAYDKYLADKGVNFNELIGPVEDPESGLDVAWGIRASLTKV